MRNEGMGMRALHLLLRPGLAVGLFLAQFTSTRPSLFTDSLYALALGAILTAAGVALWVAASWQLQRANDEGNIATRSPFRYIRHPIYVSIYVLSIGMGFLFFAWAWFAVLAAFVPLWWLEAKSEEREMRERYGKAYTAYMERTAMFIPGLW